MPSAATTSAPRWLVPERSRWWIAMVPAVVLMYPALRGLGVLGFDGADRYAAGYALTYALALVLYTGMTLLAFSRHFDACARDTSLTARRARSGRPAQRDAVTGTLVVFSAIALAAAVWFATFAPAARTSAQAVVAAVATVGLIVAAWATVATAYAADYARRVRAAGGLEFPGGGELRFGDFLYFAVGVSTTFGTTDVTVTSAELRRTVLSHSLVAFSFNTVILALLVSALLS